MKQSVFHGLPSMSCFFVVFDLVQVLPTFLLGVKKRSLESQRVNQCFFYGRCFKSLLFVFQRCFLNQAGLEDESWSL